jgi:hypothetical protein
MRAHIKCIIRRVFITFVTLCVVVYAAFFYSTLKEVPLNLRICMETSEYPYWMSWTCKQVLFHTAWNSSHVDELNQSIGVGAVFAADESEGSQLKRKSEQLLRLFMARGVNINSRNTRLYGRTALHSAAMGTHLHQAQLLLKYGARADLMDTQGQTPLDIARHVQAQKPSDPNAAEMVRLLKIHRSEQVK